MDSSKRISLIKKKIEQFAKSDSGKLVLKVFRVVFLSAILLWLGLNLYDIGWQSVWQNLPVHPVFYLIFLLMFVSAPVADIIIYRYIWVFDIWKSIPAFIKKRILNTDVVGYSGEVYFFTWARNNIGLTDLEIGETIRDNNILSALASNSRAVFFLLVFGYWAQEPIAALIGSVNWMYFAMAGAVLIIMIPIVIRFRKYIFVTSFKTAKFVFGVYFLRLAIGTVLQIIMWMVVIPDVPLVTWIVYSVISILVSRIPTSNKKLIFAGVGVEMSTSLGVPQDAIFGLLICIAALEKILNFALYLGVTLAAKLGEKQETDISADTAKEKKPDFEAT